MPVGTAQINPSFILLYFPFHHSTSSAMEIWNIQAGIVRANRTCVKNNILVILILGEMTKQDRSNNWLVVNKNHNEYGRASTQYIHTMGETNATPNAYKAANREKKRVKK